MIFSYTLIDTFHNVCERQAYERFIAKSVKVDQTEDMEVGTRVHKYIEDHINGVDPLPAWLKHLIPVIESLKQHGRGATRTELKMGVTKDLAACDFFAGDVYLRGGIDLLLATDDRALIIDWKTGKKRDKELQLLIYALFIFAVLPMIQQITCMNYFVAENNAPMGQPFTWRRSQVSEMWREVLPLIHEIEAAIASGRFAEKPSGLCSYCPVQACQHWRPTPVRQPSEIVVRARENA